MPQTLPEKVLELIGCSDRLVKEASTVIAQRDEQQAKTAELIPGVVDALIAHDLIGPEQKTAALQALQNPVTALEVLGRVAREARPVAGLGQPTKTAAAGKDSGLPESEVAWFQALGVAVG